MRTPRRSPLDEDDALFYFTNLSPKQTGLPFVVWVSPSMGARHGIRLKVSRGPIAGISEMITVAIGPRFRVVRGEMTSHDLELLRQWVELNCDVLAKHWNGESYSQDVFETVRSIGPR
jgi:hypothetical protein